MAAKPKWHLEFWVDGNARPDLRVEIVSVTDGTNYLEEDFAESGPSLSDIEAVFRFVQSQFPNGWMIENGKVKGR